MAQRKTVTSQTIIGEKGISLIGTRCLEMGYLFHPRRVDHGLSSIGGCERLIDGMAGCLVMHRTRCLVRSRSGTSS